MNLFSELLGNFFLVNTSSGQLWIYIYMSTWLGHSLWKNKVSWNEKKTKNYMVFPIPKIWAILKHFAGIVHFVLFLKCIGSVMSFEVNFFSFETWLRVRIWKNNPISLFFIHLKNLLSGWGSVLVKSISDIF